MRYFDEESVMMKVIFKEDQTSSDMQDRGGGCGRPWRPCLLFTCERMEACTAVLVVRTDWKGKAWGNI